MENTSHVEPLFDDHAAEQYLRELVEQASAGIMAAQATRLAATGAAVAGDVFVNARAVANAAAMISKVLWPGQMRRASGEDEQQFDRVSSWPRTEDLPFVRSWGSPTTVR